MLEVQSVTRHYGDVKAVDDVSFRVDRGEIVGLLGHNGAGKTTIMKMLTGFLEPDAGSIRFDGHDVVADATAVQARLGYLPEVLPVYPELEVADYLDYAAEIKGLSGATKTEALRRAIEATALGDRLVDPIATLSRGYRQRVGVAQAILGDPALVILDEPTNGLDPAQTEEMRELIRRLGERATVLLSTHVMQEVEAVCDRALIVRTGRLAIDLPLAEEHGGELRLRVGSGGAAVEAVLESIDAVVAIEAEKPDTTRRHPLGASSAPVRELRIVLAGGVALDEVAATVTRRLVQADIAVHAVQPRRQDLQRLFMSVYADPTAHTSSRVNEEMSS